MELSITMTAPAPVQTTKQLRSFGLLVGGVFTAISAFLIWRGRITGSYLIGPAVLLMVFGLVAPQMLSTVERLWMRLAHVLSVVMTFVILTLTFIFVLLPLGLLARAFGAKMLSLSFKKGSGSYWKPVEVDGPGTRPYTPY